MKRDSRRRAENAAVVVTIWAGVLGLVMVYVGAFVATFAIGGVLVWASAGVMWRTLPSPELPGRVVVIEFLVATLVLPVLVWGWTIAVVTM